MPAESRSRTCPGLVGVWHLTSFTVRDQSGGVIGHPMGVCPTGVLTYGADGSMSVHLGASGPAVPGDGAPHPEGTEGLVRRRPYLGYAGTFAHTGDRVVHRLEIASVPQWVGTEQVRAVRFDGDELTLSPPPENDRTLALTWRRHRTSTGPRPRSGFIGLPAGRFHYLSWAADGTRRPCAVLLHGNAGSARGFGRLAPALAERYRVFALDMRGHGSSVRPDPGDYGLRAAADDVRGFLAALELTDPLVVGHSWGAAVALVLAVGAESREPPPRLSGLVLEDLPATMAFPDDVVVKLQKLVATPYRDLRSRLEARNPSWHAADLDAMAWGLQEADPSLVRRLCEDGARSGDLLPLLRRVAAPLLLMRADPRRDGVLDGAAWARARAHLPARAITAEPVGVSHNMQYDGYRRVLGTLLDFTDGLER
ncbi:alpha/beta fold hydrolase [Streptomyces sp. NPDC052077]|uniref:alpha/beta fold hydrolase n=1 Tax=Streptomyces sp. NPDC052077 TaxID=3154757 RepID=UPI003449A261